MGRKATHQEIDEINGILSRVHMGTDNQVTFASQDWNRAIAISKALGGYIPKGHCSSCRMGLHDSLRLAAGLGTARRPDTNLRETRLAICHACPAYRPHTGSCGRLVFDAINSKAIWIDGKEVLPCGCLVALKVSFPTEKCPANKWPR